MIKRLTKHGNSLALVIDRGVLDLLKIDEATALEISTDGARLVISPLHDAKKQKAFRAAMARVHRRYGRAFRKLAK
jgi:antitoxin MazE